MTTPIFSGGFSTDQSRAAADAGSEAELCADLSAFLDGELGAERTRFLQRRLDHDAALRDRWERWQLAAACLRHSDLRVLPAGFAARVAAGIAQSSPSVPAARGGRWSGWRWGAGAALAASVALAAVLVTGDRFPTDDGSQVATIPTTSLPQAPISLPEIARQQSQAHGDAQQVAVRITAPDARSALPGIPTKPWPRAVRTPEDLAANAELEAYMIRHNELLPTQDGFGGFMPYVDVVTQPSRDVGTVSYREDGPQ